MLRKFLKLILILLLIAGLYWAVKPTQKKGNAIRFADGRVLRIEWATFGTNHSFNPRPYWKDKLSKILPSSFEDYWGPPNFNNSMITHRKALCLWVSLFDSQTSQYVSFYDAEVRIQDDHGCVMEGYNSGSSAVNNFLINDVLFYSFPPNSKSLRFYWSDPKTGSSASFELPNPAVGLSSHWTADSLPSARNTNGLTFTLKGIKATKRKAGKDMNLMMLSYAPEILVTRNGEPVRDWIAEGYTFVDPAGSSGISLCSHVTAWKLLVSYFKTADAAFELGEIISLPQIKNPKSGEVIPFSQEFKTGATTIQIAALCGPGQYTWSNDVCIASSPWPTSSGILDLGSQVFQTHQETKMSSSRHFLWLRHRNATPAERVRIRGKDENGRKVSLENHGPFQDSWNGQTLIVPEGAAELHLELIPVKATQLEFYVTPPRSISSAQVD